MIASLVSRILQALFWMALMAFLIWGILSSATALILRWLDPGNDEPSERSEEIEVS